MRSSLLHLCLKPLLILLLSWLSVRPSPSAEPLRPEVLRWLEAQTNLVSWSADFRQTRTLKSLTQPLSASGHVWFARPNRFRWELGNPPETVAVRDTDDMLVIYPRIKTVERYALSTTKSGPWRNALSLLEAGCPSSRSELEAQYNLLSQVISNDVCHLVLQPKPSAARRIIPRIEICFATNDLALRSTTMSFADGSTMRNDFSKSELNPSVDPERFRPSIPPEYKIIEPLKQR